MNSKERKQKRMKDWIKQKILSKNKWLIKKKEKKKGKKANRNTFWKRLLNQSRREKKPKNKNDKKNWEQKI